MGRSYLLQREKSHLNEEKQINIAGYSGPLFSIKVKYVKIKQKSEQHGVLMNFTIFNDDV